MAFATAIAAHATVMDVDVFADEVGVAGFVGAGKERKERNLKC